MRDGNSETPQRESSRTETLVCVAQMIAIAVRSECRSFDEVDRVMDTAMGILKSWPITFEKNSE